MQHNSNDEIDLRELFQTLKERKSLIYTLTGLITVLAALYAFMVAKPVYEVRAMIEIGKIDAGTKDETTLEDVEDIKQKLSYIYGVDSKKRREYPRVKSVTVGKKSQSIFSLIVEGRTNEESTTYIKDIVEKIEDGYADRTNVHVNTQKELIALTQEDMKVDTKNLKAVQQTLKDYTQKMMNITQEDAALAGLYTIQISQNQARALGLERHVSTLKSKVFNLELSITPLRIKPTHIIGQIEVLDKPVKPKKALIVIVAFITGLMFSVFLVFFLSFLKGMKEKE